MRCGVCCWSFGNRSAIESRLEIVVCRQTQFRRRHVRRLWNHELAAKVARADRRPPRADEPLQLEVQADVVERGREPPDDPRHEVAADIDVGNLLLSRAADLSSDLVVMGAYSRTRMSERVWGGVTRLMLEAMTLPVLMSH